MKGTVTIMELIRIGDSKLKITLTSDDMTQYDLDCDTMDYDNTETRKAFWDILDHAKQITGFDAAGDRVFVQLYPIQKHMVIVPLGQIQMDAAKTVPLRDIGIGYAGTGFCPGIIAISC